MIRVPGTNICYRNTPESGPEVSCDGGETWSFTFRTAAEFCDMHPGAVTDDAPARDVSKSPDYRDEAVWDLIQLIDGFTL